MELHFSNLCCGDQTDERLARFLADVIRAFASDLSAMIRWSGDEFAAASFAEAIMISREIATADALPPRFLAPGLGAFQPAGDWGRVLFLLADPLNEHRESILEKILQPSLAPRPGHAEVSLAQALAIAQLAIGRHFADAEIEQRHSAPNGRTQMERIASQTLIDFYRAELAELAKQASADNG